MDLHFSAHFVPSILPVQTPSAPHFACNTNGLYFYPQMFMPLNSEHAMAGSQSFTSLPIRSFSPHQDSLYRLAEISSQGTCQRCKQQRREFLNSFSSLVPLKRRHFLQHLTVSAYKGQPDSICQAKSQCTGDPANPRCTFQHRGFHQQVCDLVSQHGCLEVTGKEILGWYIMCAAEDRKIIKESGSLTEFLQNNPSLYVVNNWMKLRDFNSVGCENLNMETVAVKVDDLNQSRQATFFCVWSCEKCGFSNCFDVTSCRQCHAAMDILDEIIPSEDTFCSESSTTEMCSSNSFDTLPVCNHSEDEQKDMVQKHKKYNVGKVSRGQFHNCRDGESCSACQSEIGILSKQGFTEAIPNKSDRSDSRSELELSKDTALSMLGRVFNTCQEEDTLSENTSLIQSDGDRIKMSENVQCTEREQSAIETQNINCIFERWEGSKINARRNLNIETFSESPGGCSELVSLESELLHAEKSLSKHDLYEELQIHQFKDDCHYLPGHLEFLEDSGIIEEDQGIQELRDIWEQEENPSLVQWPKFHTSTSDFQANKDCSSSDICEDTFFSVQSDSCYSLGSNSSSNIFLDDLTDKEQCYFEEAMEELPTNTFHNEPNQRETLSASIDLCHLSVTIPPSTEKKSSMVSQATNIDLTLMHQSHLAEWKPKYERDVSSNTDLSCLSNYRHDKGSQTRSVKTQDCSVNTLLSVPGHCKLSQDAMNVQVGDNDGAEHCTGHQDVLGAKCFEEATQRAVRAELQLLNTQLWLCRQLCWKAHQQSMEQCVLTSLGDTAKKSGAVSFNLLSVLANLDEKYEYMKQTILAGIPLEVLTPLFEHLKSADIPVDSVLSGCLTDDLQQREERASSIDCKETLPDLDKGSKESANISIGPIPVWELSNNTETDDKGQDVEESSRSLDGSEVWFDAKNKSVAGSRENLEESEPFTAERKCISIHVGNIASSVTEIELKALFQNYQVSQVFLQEYSRKNSYAVLVLSSLSQAQAAVNEMDGKELHGQKLKVCFIKTLDHKFSFTTEKLNEFSSLLSENNSKSCSDKLLGRTVPVPPHSNPTTPATPLEEAETLTLNKPVTREDVQVSSLPLCVTPGFNNLTSAKPPWMMQPFISYWVANRAQKTYFSPSSNPPLSYPTSSPAHWFASLPSKAHRISARPVQNRYKSAQHDPMKSSAAVSANKKHLPMSAKEAVPMSSTISSCSGKISSTAPGSVQINTASLCTDGKGPDSQHISANVPETRASVQTTTDTTSALFNRPHNLVPASRTTIASFGDVTTTAAIKVHPSVPIIVTATTLETRTVTAKVSPSICSSVIYAAPRPSTLKAAVPLRVPSSVPPTVSIPGHETSNSHGKTTSGAPISSKATAFVTAKGSCAASSTNPIAAKFVSFSLPPKSGRLLEKKHLFEEEDWTVCPQLDLSTEHPTYIPLHTMNLGSFSKLMKRLTALHPECSSDHIIEALQELRVNRGGTLSGLPISSIVRKASIILTKESCQGEECKMADISSLDVHL